MNAVYNATVDVSIVTPTGLKQSKPASTSFRDIRDGLLKSQIADNAPVKSETKDSEIAAEQGLTAMTPPVVQTDAATTPDQDVQAVDALQQQISKCCDFTELTDKIADILEGFGLLRRSGETAELTQEGITLLQNMVNNIMHAEDPVEPVVFTVAGNEAGMLNTAMPDDVQHELQLLIKEYVCSLENANNPVGNDISINSGAVVDPGTGIMGNFSASIPQQEQADDSVPMLESSVSTKDALPAASETEQDSASASEIAMEKDPFTQLKEALIRSLAHAGNVVTEDTNHTQNPAASSEAEPMPLAVGSAFSHGQPMQNVNMDMPALHVTQADMAENVTNIVQELAFRSQEGVQEFSVSLKPEHLGELIIKLTKGPEGLLAQIKAADASTQGLIQNEVAALTEQLKDKGIELRQIEVLYEAPAFTTDMHQNRGHQQSAASPYKTRHYRVSGIAESYGTMIDAAASPSLLSWDSSVEFQA